MHPLGNKELKFAPSPQETLHTAAETGNLAATVRYDDEKNIASGDTLRLLTAQSNEPLGTGIVEYSAKVPVHQALETIKEHGAEYGIDDTDTLCRELNQYYSSTIKLATEVKVLLLAPTLNEPAPSRRDQTND